jgi:hypothetical protein
MMRARHVVRSSGPMSPTAGRTVVAAVVAAVVLVVGCGSDDDTGGGAGADTSAVTTSVVAPDGPPGATLPEIAEGFPPADTARLKAIFDPLVEPLGVRISRGALVDRSDGYDVSVTGEHLALYVEPIDEDSYTVDDYVAGIFTVAAAVSPTIFEDYPGVDSFDICQEPHSDDDDSLEPFPVTQIELTRADHDSYDWDDGDLVSFLRLLRNSDDARILVGRTIVGAPAYTEALAEAERLDG